MEGLYYGKLVVCLLANISTSRTSGVESDINISTASLAFTFVFTHTSRNVWLAYLYLDNKRTQHETAQEHFTFDFVLCQCDPLHLRGFD